MCPKKCIVSNFLLFLQAQDIAVDFGNILDSNSDGMATFDEVDSFLDTGPFAWHRDTVKAVFQWSDEDNDGHLTSLGMTNGKCNNNEVVVRFQPPVHSKCYLEKY